MTNAVSKLTLEDGRLELGDADSKWVGVSVGTRRGEIQLGVRR